jgi:anion transporter
MEDILKGVATIISIGWFFWNSATSQIQGQIMGVVFLALIVWSLYPRYHLLSSIIIILLLSFFQVSLSLDEFISSLFSTYGESGLWIIVSGFFLAKAMETSGLGRRIAFLIATSLSGKPVNIVLSVAIANLAVAPLSPSTTAKAFLLLPICIGLVEAFEVEKGRSNYGTAVFLMAMAANNVCSTAFLTATVPNPISAQYIKEATGLELGWLGWFRMAFPLTVILLAFSWFLLIKLYRPETKESAETIARMGALRCEQGGLSRGEKIVAVIFSVALLLWVTDGLHRYNSGLISLALSLVLFIPKLGVIEFDGFTGEVPWSSISLFAASMFLARAVGRWGALDPVARDLFDLLNLSSLDPLVFVVLVVLVSMFLHLGFTSTTVYATVMAPLVISLAQLQNIRTRMVALPISFLTPIAVILPVNTIPNLVFFSAGYFKQKQIILYGLALSMISVVVVLLIGLPYWGFLGLL